METALNVASVVFLGTLLFGFVLAGYALYGYLARRRYLVPAPVVDKLPTRALDAAHQALERLKADYYRSPGAKRTRLGHEVQRLEMRIQHLVHRTNEDQFPFYQLSRKREKVWQEWKRAFDRQEFLYGHERKANLAMLTQLVKQFRDVDKLTRDEWHRAVARDELALQELQTQGVLQIAPPEPEQAEQEAREAEAAEHGKPEQPAHEHAAGAPPAQKAASQGPASEAPPAPAATEHTPEPPMAGMHQSDFAYADLPKAGLRYADPEFSSSLAPGGLLQDADLNGCSFAGVRFAGPQVFRNVNLSRADLRGIQLPRAEQPHQFVDCDFTGAHFGGARLEYALFLRCQFAYTQWPGAQLNRVKFSDCDITGTRWDGIDLSRTVMPHEMLRQGDFSNAAQPPREPQPSPYDRSPGQPARPAPAQAQSTPPAQAAQAGAPGGASPAAAPPGAPAQAQPTAQPAGAQPAVRQPPAGSAGPRE